MKKMITNKRLNIAAVLLTAAALMTACGGSEQADSTNSEEAFAEQETSVDSADEAPKDIKLSGNTLPAGPLFYNSDSKDFFVLGSSVNCKDITRIEFLDSLENMPSDAWDISESGNGSVMAWVISDEYDGCLYIAGEGGVDANSDSSSMFGAFKKMTSIEFNDCFFTGNASDMSFMFGSCESLEKLDLSSFDTSNAEKMNYMFFNCYELEELNMDNFDTSKVTDMSTMFSECHSLKNLDLSSFNTSAVKDMNGMFNDCFALETVNITSFDTSNVGDMSAMFWCCSSLTEVDVSGFDTSNVKNMFGMFSNCSSLIKLDVSGFDTSSVEEMYDMFRNCSSLEELDISGFDIPEYKSGMLTGTKWE